MGTCLLVALLAAAPPMEGGGGPGPLDPSGREGGPTGSPEAERESRLLRVYELLVRQPADPLGALRLLGEMPSTGELAALFARALALARGGESLRAAAALEELARTIREGPGLQVGPLRLVRRVESFGVYEDDPRPALRPGDAFLVYAELAGFACVVENRSQRELRAAGPGESGIERLSPELWRVSLEIRLSLRQAGPGVERVVWGPDRVEHRTRSELRDLHVTRLAALPQELEPGDYELRLDVLDLAPARPEPRGGFGLRRLVVERR